MPGGSERQPVSRGETQQSTVAREDQIRRTRDLTAFNLLKVESRHEAISILEAGRKVSLHRKATSKLRGEGKEMYKYGLRERKVELGIEKWTELGSSC